jgi:hypothetical protein
VQADEADGYQREKCTSRTRTRGVAGNLWDHEGKAGQPGVEAVAGAGLKRVLLTMSESCLGTTPRCGVRHDTGACLRCRDSD